MSSVFLEVDSEGPDGIVDRLYPRESLMYSVEEVETYIAKGGHYGDRKYHIVEYSAAETEGGRFMQLTVVREVKTVKAPPRRARAKPERCEACTVVLVKGACPLCTGKIKRRQRR